MVLVSHELAVCRNTLDSPLVDGLIIEDIRAERLSAQKNPTLVRGGEFNRYVLEQILQQLNAAVQESIHL